jgi:hypothetical protein
MYVIYMLFEDANQSFVLLSLVALAIKDAHTAHAVISVEAAKAYRRPS